MAAMLSLPQHVLEAVVEASSGDSLLALRQTCRAANTLTLDMFIRRHFRTYFVLLERRSLDTLAAIAQHPALRHGIVTLGFSTDQPSAPNGSPESVREALRQHRDFLQNEAKDSLITSMRNLTNCKALVLSDVHIPWGAVSLEATGFALRNGFCSPVSPGRSVFDYFLTGVLGALKESELAVKELELHIDYGNLPVRPPSAFADSFATPQHDHAVAAAGNELTKVTSLRLSAEPRKTNTWMEYQEPAFGLLLAQLPQLSNLAVEFSNDAQGYHVASSALFNGTFVPQLCVLELNRLAANLAELSALLERHQSTLTHVKFREVALFGESGWSALLRDTWRMPSVRCITMERCGIYYSTLTTLLSETPPAMHITDGETLDQMVAWVERAEEVFGPDPPGG